MGRGVAVDQLVELRSYALVPGRVEAFVEHFELHFLASQEELGMDVVGQFTVPGDDARFVWIRRFLEPSARGDALARFYGGPVWKEFGPRANELMVDHTDVHLLVPHRSAPAFAADHVPHAQRPDACGSRRGDETGSAVVAAVYELAGTAEPPAAAMTAARQAASGGVTELGRLVTAGVPNDFPRLPVHEDVTVAVREERWGFGLAPHLGQPNDTEVVNDDQLDRAAVDSQPPPPGDPTPNQRERPVRRRGQFRRAGSSFGVFDHEPGRPR